MEGRGRRVVITGIGVVAPCGLGKEAYWDGLLRPVTELSPTRGVADWDPSPWFANPKEARRADRFQQFALAAAGMAVDDAGGEPPGDPARKGVVVATGIGGFETPRGENQNPPREGGGRGGAVLVSLVMA